MRNGNKIIGTVYGCCGNGRTNTIVVEHRCDEMNLTVWACKSVCVRRLNWLSELEIVRCERIEQAQQQYYFVIERGVCQTEAFIRMACCIDRHIECGWMARVLKLLFDYHTYDVYPGGKRYKKASKKRSTANQIMKMYSVFGIFCTWTYNKNLDSLYGIWN